MNARDFKARDKWELFKNRTSKPKINEVVNNKAIVIKVNTYLNYYQLFN